MLISLGNLIETRLSKEVVTTSQYILYETDSDLYHYGVLGMKWGIRRANRKAGRRDRLTEKALSLDAKASKLTKKSEKAHAKHDLEEKNKASVKAAKLSKKAAKAEKKAENSSMDIVRDARHRKAEKLKYKAAKSKLKGNRIAKTTGYGHKAMRYSVKSDKVAKKAAKVRMKLANDKYYISKMNTKISELPKSELQAGYSFVNEMKKF